MNDIEIKRHNFDLAKKRLKEFSENKEAELEIRNVRTEGRFFGLGDHKVTGSEFNSRLETIQDHFINVNERNNKVIKEFREVYNALDALDKDYITAIISNLKAIEKTSNDVRRHQNTLDQHHEKLANQQNKLNAHQNEIDRTLDSISGVVTVLKSFKKELDSYKHLSDVDKIWNDCKTIQNEIKVVSDSITKFSNNNRKLLDQIDRDIVSLNKKAKSSEDLLFDLYEKLESTENSLNNQILIIQEISHFIDKLENIDHISDIDNMWDKLEVCEINVDKLDENIQINKNEIDILAKKNEENKDFIDCLDKKLSDLKEYEIENRKSITSIEAFKEKVLELNHLMEIDNIWDKVEGHQDKISAIDEEVKSHKCELNELNKADNKIRESITLKSVEIDSLKEYKNKLDSIYHLKDVDDIWKDVEEHKHKIFECKKKELDLANIIQKNRDDLDKDIKNTVQTTNIAIETLTKKIKYLYWIVGGSLALAIIELILLISRGI